MEMFNHWGLLRNKGLPLGLYITRWLPALRSWWATVSGAQVALVFPFVAGQCASLEEQMRRLAEQSAQEKKAHIELASMLADHIKHVGKLAANYKTLTDDLTELYR